MEAFECCYGAQMEDRARTPRSDRSAAWIVAAIAFAVVVIVGAILWDGAQTRKTIAPSPTISLDPALVREAEKATLCESVDIKNPNTGEVLPNQHGVWDWNNHMCYLNGDKSKPMPGLS